MGENDTEGKAPSALVIVDMISPYDFPDADAVAEHAPDVVRNIRRLLDRCRDEGIQIIYVNDNYGDWNSSSEELFERAMQGKHPELVEPLQPQEGEAFVIKARHSIFYGTPLEYLLATQGIGRVVLTGQVTEQCILYSALDAYVRNFRLAVVQDAVAHIDEDLAHASLRMMEANMNADLERTEGADLS
jgi:nicotinamidase-related amidase